MKADATLVNAAFALGRSYVPGDYSAIFEKQYEGIIAANAAKYKMYGDIATSAGNVIGGAIEDYGKRKGLEKGINEELTKSPEKPEGYGKRKADHAAKMEGLSKEARDKYVKEFMGGLETPGLDAPGLLGGAKGGMDAFGLGDGGATFESATLDQEISKMATTHTVGALTALDAHITNGGSFSDLQFDAAQGEFERIKLGLEGVAGKLFPSKEDKKLRNKLRKEALALRSTINNSIANVKVIGKLYKDGEVDLTSFEEDVVINKVNHLGPDLNFLVGQIFDPTTDEADQVEFFFENGQKMIRYAPGRAGVQYRKNNKIKGGKIPKSEWKTISENQLLNQVQKKDKDTNAAQNAHMTTIMDSAESKIGKTDNFEHDNFNKIYDRAYKGNVDILSGKDVNFRYNASQDQLVGNQIINYKDDLLENDAIDVAVINQLGIGSDVFTEKELKDGKIDQAEFEKHKATKKIIIDKLTNPKTREEREVAVSELAKYWTEHNRTAFNDRRGKVGLVGGNGDGNGGDKKSYVKFPWGNKLEAVDATERTQQALAQQIADGQKDIQVGADIYTMQDSGNYQLTGEVKGGKVYPVTSSTIRTKSFLLNTNTGRFGRGGSAYYKDDEVVAPANTTPIYNPSATVKELNYYEMRNILRESGFHGHLDLGNIKLAELKKEYQKYMRDLYDKATKEK